MLPHTVWGWLNCAASIFWLWMLFEAATNRKLKGADKITWLLVVLFLWFVGALLYFVIGRKQQSPQTDAVGADADNLVPEADPRISSGQIVAIYASIALFTIAPLLSVLIASAIAWATGSKLDEGNAHPCVILGIDIGDLLYCMFVSGWFMLATIPLGLLATAFFTIYWIIRKLAGR
jgi:Phospholipase_D-nuclease N-terminal